MWFDQNFRFKYLFEETSKKMGKIRQMTATTYCHWWNDNITNIMIWRFYFYFQPLPTWVRRDSKIIADFSVDRERLLNMGYSNVFQCSAGASSKRGENTNSTIMDYLKRVVPRMFQVIVLFFFTNVSLGFYILEPVFCRKRQKKVPTKKLGNGVPLEAPNYTKLILND